MEYRTWRAMKARCHNTIDPKCANYGGRGIRVCERWANSFEAFLEDMGRKPSPRHSIDRVDNDGNYEPSNCRWATPKEQANNQRLKRSARMVEWNGKTQTMSDWARELGISVTLIHYRLEKGWSPAEALRPARKWVRK